MTKTTELLAPASNLKSVIAAVNCGCDAIYIGGKFFNARAFADSPNNEQLKEIIDLCHLRNVKVFITLNTLYKNDELQQLCEFANLMYQYGADAFIVQDIGFMQIIKQYFPHIEIHCSTQMTIHNTSAAVFFDKVFNTERVVLSRELSLSEIKDITNSIECDCECFVHGALCVSYSGRCLMSSIIGNRSGNRGRCAQPCRMEYTLVKNGNFVGKTGFLISPKDISTVEMVDELIDAGIYSFKIEGRMKSAEYVAQVVSTYRTAIDGKKLTKENLLDLKQIFNRGGEFSNGYYNLFAGNKMLSPSPKSSGTMVGKVIKSKKNACIVKLTADLNCGDGVEIWNKNQKNTGCGISAQLKSGDTIALNISGEEGCLVYKSFDKLLNDRLKQFSKQLVRQQEVKAYLRVVNNKPISLKLQFNNIEIEVTDEDSIPQIAKKQPMTSEDFIARLQKTGDTPFVFKFVSVEVEDNLFMPASTLNRLRRTACELLEKAVIDSTRRNSSTPILNIPQKTPITEQKLTVFVETAEQLNTVLLFKPYRIYVELNKNTIEEILNAVTIAHQSGTELFVALPRISRNDYASEIQTLINKIEQSDIDGYLVRNYNSINTEKQIMYDYCFNAMNGISADYFKNITLSPELTTKELKSISGKGREIVVYGYLTLMSTHQCPVGNSTGCKNGKFCKLKGNNDKYYLKDRTNALLPILTHCNSCTAFILNSQPIYLTHKWSEIMSIGAEFMRIDFTIENKDAVTAIMSAYNKAFKEKTNIVSVLDTYTTGHFFRRVQ